MTLIKKNCQIPSCQNISIPQVSGVGISNITSNNGIMTILLTSGVSINITLPVGPQGEPGETPDKIDVAIQETEYIVDFEFPSGAKVSASFPLPPYVVGAIDENCLDIEEGDTFDEVLEKIIDIVCPPDGSPWDKIPQGVEMIDYEGILDDGRESGSMSTPLQSYAVSPIVWSNQVALAVTISANKYWIDQIWITKAQESVTLLDDKDNYLRINRNDDYEYSIYSLDIGTAAPTNDEDFIYIAKITVTGGVISDAVQIIDESPIHGSMIEDGTITVEKIDPAIIANLYNLSEGHIFVGDVTGKATELDMLSPSATNPSMLLASDTVVYSAEIKNDEAISNVQLVTDGVSVTLEIKEETIIPEHLKIELGVLPALPDSFMLWCIKVDGAYQFRPIELVEGGILVVIGGEPQFIVES